jgi:hypothetical protein
MTLRKAIAVFLFVSLAAPALAVDVGEVVLVRNSVRGTVPGQTARQLAKGDALVLNVLVETGPDSATKMTFDPKGALTLGAKSKVTLDRARVDEETGRNESALSIAFGRVRLALSKSYRGEVKIDTPTATVGVKGTDVWVEVDEATGTTVVTVLEGKVSVTTKTGCEVTLSAGTRTVVAPGQHPTLPAAIEPGSSTLSASAGGPAFTLPQEHFPPRIDPVPRDGCSIAGCQGPGRP